MIDNKLEVITKLFEGKEIRSVWNKEKQDYYFSVVDVISVLTDSPRPRKYWGDLKFKLLEEGSQLSENIGQLKMKAKDGKFYNTDVLDTEGIFRLVESVPSKKAEALKLWLAKLGRQEIDNVFDPSKGIDKMVDYYLKKGYTLEWIESRIKAILNRKKLTNAWKENGIDKESEFAMLTNEIYKTWAGMTALEYKNFKGIRKENLRDNMTDIEVILTDLGEAATREIVRKHKPLGFKENKKIAKEGGNVAKIARKDLEEKLGEAIISDINFLDYQYNNKDY